MCREEVRRRKLILAIAQRLEEREGQVEQVAGGEQDKPR